MRALIKRGRAEREKIKKGKKRHKIDSQGMGEGIPLRIQRKLCYQARDEFFLCCDENDIPNPLKDVDSVQKLCRGEKAKFEKDCISSWVIEAILRDNYTDRVTGGLFHAKTNNR
jgi:Cytochrome oxidase c subunit VIb